MSISHAEASVMMSMSLEKMYQFVRRYGHHYPVLYVLNKGAPLELPYVQSESVLSVDNEVVEPGDKPEHIYRTLVGFKLQTEEDERNVQAVAEQVARESDPDAIGLLMPCRYAEYTDEDEEVPENLDGEPEACTIMHVCYWLRGESKSRITQAPFQTDGKHADKETLEWASQDENEVNYGLVAASYPWTEETDRLRPKLENPWRKQ